MDNNNSQMIPVSFSEIKNNSISEEEKDFFEFHVSIEARKKFELSSFPFTTNGNVIFANFKAAQSFAENIRKNSKKGERSAEIGAGALNAVAIIEEISHAVCKLYRTNIEKKAFDISVQKCYSKLGTNTVNNAFIEFTNKFPPKAVFEGEANAKEWLEGLLDGKAKTSISLEELFLLRLANENPAFKPYRFLFDNTELCENPNIDKLLDEAELCLSSLPPLNNMSLPDLLRAPMRASPYSLSGQLNYMKKNWGLLLGSWLESILGAIDMLEQETRPCFPAGPGPIQAPSYEGLDNEYENFSEDKEWMPRVVMIAKTILVWMDQLSKKYQYHIGTLDAIPEEEYAILASRGFNALWLIGIWERSDASRRIKELCGNPEAAASAYSLYDYEIAGELGGWSALEEMRRKANAHGIRLAADMVPNHTGIDSDWVRNRPDLFISRNDIPFSSYTFSGENLSKDSRIGLWLEDHYYSRSDASVVFKRVDFQTGNTTYIYHGNDGTSMPWNDTAQIDFCNPNAREAVKQKILHVARNFPIIRFDAAMILAKKSFRRLWFPEPGAGGSIASRYQSAISMEAFNKAIPNEFWREVVDMCAEQAPDTLLLAEAFWMMEGYFVRTLGMHRVYNSAFMNMFKTKKNAEYRQLIKSTLEFDKDILKRYVNFMNNPDEETAVAQFGKADQYFGVCTMMATMPGLPMFGHGQIEGYTEKYGMEYRHAYKDEKPDEGFVAYHEKIIFPLLKKRYLFSGVDQFELYNCYTEKGSIDENVFAFSNGYKEQKAIVVFNNEWTETKGTIKTACTCLEKKPNGEKEYKQNTLSKALGISNRADAYIIMRENTSNLWFIRNCQEISNNGLHICLRGFESQVFLDIKEVFDSQYCNWGLLCQSLNGNGVEDIDIARQEILFGSLYSSWSAIFNEDFFYDAISSSFDKTIYEKWLENITSENICVLLNEIKKQISFKNDSLETEKSFQEIISNSIELLKIAFKSSKAKSKREKLASTISNTECIKETLYAAISLIPFVVTREFSRNGIHSILDGIAMRRKIISSFTKAGCEYNKACLYTDFAIEAVSIVFANDSKFGQKSKETASEKAGKLALSISNDMKTRKLLGANYWNGILWVDAWRTKLGVSLCAILTYLRVSPEKSLVDEDLKSANVFDTLNAFMKKAEKYSWDLDAIINGEIKPLEKSLK